MENENRNHIIVTISTAIALAVAMAACTKTESNSATGEKTAAAAPATDSMGVGPITSAVHIESQVNTSLASKGKALFEAKCTACHKFEAKYVGPALDGVTKRRRPEWIMNMILNPSEMIQKDEAAKALLAEHLTQMANQNLSQEEARAVFEYFRQHDSGH